MLQKMAQMGRRRYIAPKLIGANAARLNTAINAAITDAATHINSASARACVRSINKLFEEKGCSSREYIHPHLLHKYNILNRSAQSTDFKHCTHKPHLLQNKIS